MSSRTLGAVTLLVLSALALAATTGGCSDDETPAAADAGPDVVTPNANRPAPPENEAGEPKSCREKCEEAHPTALPKDEAVNSCWETFCAGPCVEELPPDGGAHDSGHGGADGGVCVSPVVTVSPSCDECTTAFCCEAWDGCFQDPECTALNACYQQCVD